MCWLRNWRATPAPGSAIPELDACSSTTDMLYTPASTALYSALYTPLVPFTSCTLPMTMAGPTRRTRKKCPLAGLEPTPRASMSAHLATLLGTPAFMLFMAGLVFGSAFTQALQAFFPGVAVLLGLWPDAMAAAVSFGGAIVLGAVLGGPAHGFVAGRLEGVAPHVHCAERWALGGL